MKMSETGELQGRGRTRGREQAGIGDQRSRRPHFRPGKRAFPYLLITPAAIFEACIHIMPMLVGIGISLLGLTLFYVHYWTQSPFIGLKNYAIALNFAGPVGSGLLHSFLITVAYTVLVVGASWLLGLGAALILNASFRGRGIFRTLFLIPFALPWYVEVITWRFMFQKNNGAVNTLLSDVHLIHSMPFWLIGGNAFWSMVIAAVWRTWPFAFLFLLAGLQTLPADVYEAASADGASRWQQFLRLTLPLLSPVNLVVVLVMFLWTFNDFNTPYVLFGQAPPSVADLLALHIYIASFINWNFGLGSAMSVLLLLFLLIVSVIYIRVFRVGGTTNA